MSKLKNIDDIDDFNEAASVIFERFLQSFYGNSDLLRPVTEEDDMEEEWQFVYTAKGQRLAERMKDRLFKVGLKYFPDDEIEIETHLFQEY